MLSSISRVIANIAPILVVVIFSKLTSVEQLGELNYFIALITLLGVFSDFGIPEAIQTFLPKQKKDDRLIMPYLVMEFGLVAVTALVIYLLDTTTNGQISHGQLTMLIILTLASAANTVIIVFNGLLKRVRLGAYYLGMAVLLMAATFGLYFFGGLQPVDAFLWGRLISWIVFLIVPLVDLYVTGHLKWKWTLPFEQLRFTFNNFLVRAFYTLTFQWDSLLVSFVSGAYVTGYFRTVAVVANAPLMLVTFISTKWLPEYSALVHAKRFREVSRSYRRTTSTIFVIGLILSALSIPLANLGLRILFTQEIADAGSGYFILLFVACMMYVLAIPALTVMQAMTRAFALAVVSAIQAGLFVVLSTLLYPIYGLVIVPTLLIGVNLLFALAVIVYVHYSLSKAIVAGSGNLTR